MAVQRKRLPSAVTIHGRQITNVPSVLAHLGCSDLLEDAAQRGYSLTSLEESSHIPPVEGEPPIYFAAREGHLDTVRYIAEETQCLHYFRGHVGALHGMDAEVFAFLWERYGAEWLSPEERDALMEAAISMERELRKEYDEIGVQFPNARAEYRSEFERRLHALTRIIAMLRGQED